MKSLIVISIISIVMLIGCQKGNDAVINTELQKKAARFTPTEISADISHLSEGDKKALDVLIKAGKLMDKIYFQQVRSHRRAAEGGQSHHRRGYGLHGIRRPDVRPTGW